MGNGLAALTGCVVGAGVTAFYGATLTPYCPMIGGSIGLTAGCRVGLAVGPILFNGWRIGRSLSENLQDGLEEYNDGLKDIIAPEPNRLQKLQDNSSKFEKITNLIQEIFEAISKQGSRCLAQDLPPSEKSDELTLEWYGKKER